MFGVRSISARKTQPVTDAIFTTTQNWTVPDGVTSIDIVCIGKGGNGNSGAFNPSEGEYNAGGGGGGGGLSYVNNFSVTPGQVLTISFNSGQSSVSFFSGSPFIWANDGNSGSAATSSSGGTGGAGGTAAGGAGVVVFSGGSGGNGGTAGFAGGGSGGRGGSAGTYTANGINGTSGGDGGHSATFGNGTSLFGVTPGGGTLYGAGAPGSAFDVTGGAPGAVRIMWGTGKDFPSNAGP